MTNILKINERGKIGFKKLSKSDLSSTDTSNQTHIGLFDDTLEFITTAHRTSLAKLIYQNSSKELVCLLDFIENPDGSFRSPKIRKGNINELRIGGVEASSIVREIREIANSFTSNENWYLVWFGLTNTELVFYLIRENSNEYREMLDLIPAFNTKKRGGRIENTDPILGGF
jgi:hypothetical protein